RWRFWLKQGPNWFMGRCAGNPYSAVGWYFLCVFAVDFPGAGTTFPSSRRALGRCGLYRVNSRGSLGGNLVYGSSIVAHVLTRAAAHVDAAACPNWLYFVFRWLYGRSDTGRFTSPG